MRKKFSFNKPSWIGYAVAVVLQHMIGIIGLMIISRDHTELWSIGVLAYLMGLRHAFDIDHIAAIDNSVRKLIQQNRSALGVGFYFSLGHSSVVFIMVVIVAISVKWAQAKLPQFQEIGGAIGATVSGSFLLIIGLINVVILFQLIRVIRRLRNGSMPTLQAQELLAGGGLIYRLTAPIFRFIDRSWHLYPLGFLFGLGFDTATEIGLLTMSATTANQALPIFGILSFPILFAAGMSLMDTADGIFMTKAYRWAFTNPIRKMYYNLTVTSISIGAALLIGFVQLAHILSERNIVKGSFWTWIDGLEFEMYGYALVGLFVISFAISLAIARYFRYKDGLPSAEV